jgi:hypothetical protein
MSDDDAEPLGPQFEQAIRDAIAKTPGETPLHSAIVRDNWLVLSAAGENLGDHGRYMVSDTYASVSAWR